MGNDVEPAFPAGGSPCPGVIETSSGNTGCAVAALGALMGVSVKIISGRNIAEYNKKKIISTGAELLIYGDSHAERIAMARDIAAEEDLDFLNQYENYLNPKAHECWTAPEVFSQFPSCQAVFVCASSGGTASGFHRYISRNVPKCTLFVVDPLCSCALKPARDPASRPLILGFGSSERSMLCGGMSSPNIIDETEIDAISTQRSLFEALGVDVGFSSAGILHGAVSWLNRQESDLSVVCICPDSSTKYVSADGAVFTPAALPDDFSEIVRLKREFFAKRVVNVERIDFR